MLLASSDLHVLNAEASSLKALGLLELDSLKIRPAARIRKPRSSKVSAMFC